MTGGFLFPHQEKVLNKIKDGSVLLGGVGSGKSRTSLYYYFKEYGGYISKDEFVKMTNPPDLYIITTAKKRNDLEWEKELAIYRLTKDKKLALYNHSITIDSWNNIKKYEDVKNAFFIFDEQRLVSYGAWAKAFLKISKHNRWILLSATPGDTYEDYVPLFLANGFFKNKTEFYRAHVIYDPYVDFPKVKEYRHTQYLDKLKAAILVQMPFKRDVKKLYTNVECKWDKELYLGIINNWFDPFEELPIENGSKLFYVARKAINSHISRLEELKDIVDKHKKVIIFYNFTYERDLIRSIDFGGDVSVAEYNGQKHENCPTTKKWIYICQYASACEGWENIDSNCIVFYSQSHSYKMMVQAAGRIDRLNTPHKTLYYYIFKSKSPIDISISRSLINKKKFNEAAWIKKHAPERTEHDRNRFIGDGPAAKV